MQRLCVVTPKKPVVTPLHFAVTFLCERTREHLMSVTTELTVAAAQLRRIGAKRSPVLEIIRAVGESYVQLSRTSKERV